MEKVIEKILETSKKDRDEYFKKNDETLMYLGKMLDKHHRDLEKELDEPEQKVAKTDKIEITKDLLLQVMRAARGSSADWSSYMQEYTKLCDMFAAEGDDAFA